MEEIENNETQKSVKKKRILLKISYAIIFLFLISDISLYFFATPLLKNYLQTKVEKETQGLFTVDFDKISIEIGLRLLKLENFKLISDTSIYNKLIKDKKAEAALYNISCSSIEFWGTGLYKLFINKKLNVSELKLNDPIVDLKKLPDNNIDIDKRDFVHEDLFPSISIYLNEIKIKTISLNNGKFNLNINQDSTKKTKHVGFISVKLNNFLLNQKEFDEKAKLFYSEDISIEIDNYKIKLSDNIHYLFVENIYLSSKKSILTAVGVKVNPISNSKKYLNNLEDNYYRFKTSIIEINNFNLNQLYFDKNINIQQLTIDNPEISIINKYEKDEKTTKSKEIDLYNLIKGKFISISIDSLKIKNGKLNYFYNTDIKNEASYKTGSLNLKLYNFVLDEHSKDVESKIFYSDDIYFNLNSFYALFPNNNNQLYVENIWVNTFNKELSATNIKFSQKKINKSKNLINKALFDIKIPNIKLNGVRFKNFYHSRNIYLQSVNFSSSNFDAIFHNKQDKKISETDIINSIFSDFIKSIYIKNFNIKKSNFNFKIYQNDSVYNNYSGKVIFDLRSFNLNKYQNQNQNKLFYADGFKLQLFDYSQDLKDRTHSINLDNITISSFDSLLYISKLSVQPRNDLKTYSDLEKKHINKIYSFSIQNSKIEGVDINKAYFDSILDIKSISINNPKFIFSNYTDIYELADTNSIIEEKTNNLDSDFADLDLIEKILEPDSTKHNKSLKDLLSSYYSIINIRNLNLQKGDFKYLEIDSNINIDVMMSGKLSVRLNEFRFDTKKSELKNKFSYSDNIQFAIDDFQMKFFDKNYQLKVKRAIFSSKDSIFNATIVRVFPTNKLLNSNNKKNTYTIYTPNIITKGTNSGEFIDNNILDFGNVLIKSPVIALSQKEIDEKTFSETDKNKKHRFPFQKIWFNKIEIDSGIFGLMNTNKFDINNLSIKTKFSANLFEIEIDSNKINNPKNIFKNLNAIATIYDLHYQMPDSIHFTDIKKIEINILQSKIYGDSLHYYNINANQIFRDFNKNEIDNLVIPKFYLNGFKFDNFFINKDLNLDTLLIIKPEIEIADFKTNGNNEKKLSQLNLYKKIYPKLKSINISEIEIDSAKLKLTANNKKRPFGNSFNNLFGNISNLIIDSVNQTRKNKILNSDDIKLKMKDYELNLSDSLYNFRFKEIGISTALHRLYIDLITINPNIERDKFADKNKKEFTLNYFFGKKIIAQNVDFVNLIDNKKIIIENINLLDFNLHTYKNKKFPLDSIKKIALPLDYIKKYDNYVLIDTISIKNSYIGYEILGKDANETGVIDLIDLEGRITNITNDKEKIKNQESTKLNLSAYLMNEGLLSASFDFPLNSKYGEYNFAGTLDSMSALPFNPLLENLLFVSLKEGYIDSAEFYVNVNEDYAEGNMKLAYSDLKVNLISKKKTDSLLVEKRGFATMVANSIIKGSNPKTKNSRLKENRIYYERNIYKPVFHYWTQSLLTGIKATLGFKSKEFKDRLKFEKISSRFNEKLRLKNKRKYNKTDKKKSKNTLKEAKHQKRIRKKEEKKKKKKL